MKKAKTLAQVATAKQRAVNFLTNVLEDDDRADEVEEESLEAYAERKGIQIIDNPSRHVKGKTMTATKADLQAVIDQVADAAANALDPRSNRVQLVDALQAIYDLTGEDDDEDDSDVDDDDEEDEE